MLKHVKKILKLIDELGDELGDIIQQNILLHDTSNYVQFNMVSILPRFVTHLIAPLLHIVWQTLIHIY